MHFLLSHVNFLSLSFLDEGHHPCFIVFDILIINEKKLANVPLRERIKSMEEWVHISHMTWLFNQEWGLLYQLHIYWLLFTLWLEHLMKVLLLFFVWYCDFSSKSFVACWIQSLDISSLLRDKKSFLST